MTLAANTAAPFVAAPLAAGDAKVAAALDELERRVPLVTEQPKVIVETTKQAVLSRITPQINKVSGFHSKKNIKYSIFQVGNYKLNLFC